MQETYKIFKVSHPAEPMTVTLLISHCSESSQVFSTQLVALDEILELSVTDPVIRFILKEFDIYRLSTEYSEPDLIISTSKALGSLENAYVHDIWSSIISSHGHRIFANETSFNLVLNTLRYVMFILHSASVLMSS